MKIYFIHYLRLIAVICVVISMSGCHKKKVEKPKEDTPLIVMNAKIAFLKKISGFWTDNKISIYIVYSGGLFQFWQDDVLVSAQPGDFDPKQGELKMVVINSENGQPQIAILKRKWNFDKSAFNLIYTDIHGTQRELAMMRQLTMEDITRLVELATKQTIMPPHAQIAASQPVQSTPDIEDSNTLVPLESSQIVSVIKPTVPETLSSDDTVAIVSQLRMISEHENSTDNLAGLYADKVNYGQQGQQPLSSVLADKQRYFQQWPSRKFERLGDITVKDGKTPDIKEASYRYRFTYTNGKQAKSGTALKNITIQRIEGRNLIVQESEKIINNNDKRKDSYIIIYQKEKNETTDNKPEISAPPASAVEKITESRESSVPIFY